MPRQKSHQQPPADQSLQPQEAADLEADTTIGPVRDEEPTEDSIDESLEETFPASDPPSFMAKSGD